MPDSHIVTRDSRSLGSLPRLGRLRDRRHERAVRQWQRQANTNEQPSGVGTKLRRQTRARGFVGKVRRHDRRDRGAERVGYLRLGGLVAADRGARSSDRLVEDTAIEPRDSERVDGLSSAYSLRIERGELLRAVHEPDLCRALRAAPTRDAALEVVEQ